VVIDEARIPDDYWRQPPRVLDRVKLNEEMNVGVIVDGAALSNPKPVLILRKAKRRNRMQEVDSQ
jgi:hypothetical protein